MYWRRLRGNPIDPSGGPGPDAAHMSYREDVPPPTAAIVRNISHWSAECSCHLRLGDDKIVRDEKCEWTGKPDLEQYYCAA